MCGILGGNILNWNYKNGIDSLWHRGPDGSMVEQVEDFTLAFTRLAIRDLSDNGMQPMSALSDKVWIVFNGEIYGFDSLRLELSKKYHFRSTTDTEVLLYAYLEYGDSFIDKVDGIFAIAILDLRIRKLKLYRDRAGVKPLYYFLKNGYIAFTSELKAFISATRDNGFTWSIDYTALYDYLFYQYIPAPKTMFADCFMLPPASRLSYDIDAHKVEDVSEYWILKVNGHKETKRNVKDIYSELRYLLHESIKQQLVADVPVGTFLSGGIDSSIVTYEASRINPVIKTFTIGFLEKAYDESCFAKEFAQLYNLNNIVEYFSDDYINKIKSIYPSWFDEPFADTSAFPTYLVASVAKKYVTVVLTGDGGDELFGGYQRYQIHASKTRDKVIDSNLVSRLVNSLRLDLLINAHTKHKYILSSLDEYLPYIFIANKKSTFKYKWGIPDDYDVTWHLKKFYKKDLPLITRLRYLDFKTYLPGDILTKVDRTSMAVSLEARVPFLSRKLIEYAFSLSEDECSTIDNLKQCLKEAYKDVLPTSLLHRKKRGFSIPPIYKETKSRYNPISSVMLDKYWEL